MTINVAADNHDSTHDVSLSDGSTTIGLLLARPSGDQDPTLIPRSAYPRTSTQIRQGEQEYSDLELPYQNTPQSDWSAGRGNLRFSDNAARYLEGYGVNTTVDGQLILAGRDKWNSGGSSGNNSANAMRRIYDSMPGDVYMYPLGSTSSYDWVSDDFGGGAATATVSEVFVWVGVEGTPANDLTVAIYSDTGGKPNSSLASATLQASDFPYDDGRSQLVKLSISQTITSTLTYHIVISSEGSTSANGWLVGVDNSSASGGWASADGSTWSAFNPPFYLIAENAKNFEGIFFEYKRGIYFVTKPEDSAQSSVYINGDRGAADSNSGDLSKLNDSSKSSTWASNQFANAIVLITNGPGSEEEQPWRKITSNTSTALTVSPNFKIAHTTDTEYVILGSDIWTLVTSGVTNGVKDVAVARDWVYFCYGDDAVVTRYQAYNSGGTWTERNASEVLYATYLKVIRNYDDEIDILWGGFNDNTYGGSGVWKAWVPPHWANLFSPIKRLGEIDTLLRVGLVVPTWSTAYGAEGSVILPNISGPAGTRQGGVRFTDGVSIDDAYGMALSVRSEVSRSANDIGLELYNDPAPLFGNWELLAYFYHLTRSPAPAAFYWYNGTAYEPITNMTVRDPDFDFAFTLQTTTHLYIGGKSRFDTINFDFAAFNATGGATLDVEYWNGFGWSNADSLTDNTDTGGSTPFAQNGTVTWTINDRWTKGIGVTDNGSVDSDLYYVRITTDVNLDAATFDQLTLQNSEEDQTSPLEEFVPLPLAHDGDDTDALLAGLDDNDYLYCGHPHKFDSVNITLGTTKNSVGSVAMSGEYWDGENWTSLPITDGTASGGTTLAGSGPNSVTFTAPADWGQVSVNGQAGYWIRLSVSAAITTYIDIEEVSIGNNAAKVVTIADTLSANVWEWTEIVLWPTGITEAEQKVCYGLGIRSSNSLSAGDFYLRGDMWLTRYGAEFIYLEQGSKVTGIEAYGQDHKNPWVFTDSGVFEIQTENGDKPVPLPLGEIDALRSETNGRAHCVNDVYLYFNLGEHVERYFNRTLDNVGFNVDEGLPSNRRGQITKLLSYPGRVFAAVRATGDSNQASGYSSVLVRKGGEWHEFYRAPKGVGIYDLAIQVVPGDVPDRLYIALDGHVIAMPIPSDTFNPYNDDSYVFTHEGWLITSWIDTGLVDVPKFWKSVKLISENLENQASTGDIVIASYQLETGSFDSGWTELGDPTYDTSPFQENDLTSTTPPNVTGRRIRFMFRVQTRNELGSPRVLAYVVESLMNIEPKYSWTLSFVSGDIERNLSDTRNFLADATDVFSQLDTWSGAPPVPLIMRSRYKVFDSKTVVVQPPGVRPISIDDQVEFEEHHGEVTLLEI